jgi:hypothetical protein
MNSYRNFGDTVPLTFGCGIRWTWVVNLMSRALCSEKRHILIGGRGLGILWYCRRAVVYGEEKSLTPTRIRTSDRLALNLVTIPTTLLSLAITKRTFAYACVIYFTINLLVNEILQYFLGAFTKLRKATISFVMSLCPFAVYCLSVSPSVGIEQLSSFGRIFTKIHKSNSRKSITIIQVPLKSDSKNRYFT